MLNFDVNFASTGDDPTPNFVRVWLDQNCVSDVQIAPEAPYSDKVGAVSVPLQNWPSDILTTSHRFISFEVRRAAGGLNLYSNSNTYVQVFKTQVNLKKKIGNQLLSHCQ